MDTSADTDPRQARAARRAALFDALLAGHEQLSVAVREEMQRQLPTYRELPADLIDPSIDRAIEGTLRASRTAVGPPSEARLAEFVDLEDLAEIGRTQAELGVPLSEVLSTWRIGIETIMGEAAEHAERLGVPADEMLDAVRAIIGWVHTTTMGAARAHQTLELELARHDQQRRADFIRGVLLGTLSPASIRIEAQVYGIEPGREYVTIRARPAAGDSSAALRRTLGLPGTSVDGRGLDTVIDGDVAAFLRTPPGGAASGVVGLGPARPLERLSESFRLATRAMITAASSGLVGVHDFDSLGILPAIAADAEVGEALHRRYIEPLAASASASELLTTLRAYFACSMHAEPAAQQLFIHPNTVRYRLGVFEKLTAADLREPRVAFEVFWALEHAAMARHEEPGDQP